MDSDPDISPSRLFEEVVSNESSINRKIELLNSEIFPAIVEDFNTGMASERLTRLTKDIEPVPDHSRNVTEIRTRVGLLLEFNLGIVIEEYLPDDHVVSYGASQAHTDLVLRGSERKPTVRLEVKAIEDIAEEKAASYEDMVHSIDPTRDILAIFAWGWMRDWRGETETRVPKLYDLRAFEMREIAMARDLFWSQSPKGDNKNMLDFSMPVIQKSPGELKEEEGNMGKLMRIIDESDLESHPELNDQLNFDELHRYIEYMSFCKGAGINRAAEHYFDQKGYEYDPRENAFIYDGRNAQFVNYGTQEEEPPLLVFSGGSQSVRTGNYVSTLKEKVHSVMKELEMSEADVLVIENEKFKWNTASASSKDFGSIGSIEIDIRGSGENIFGDRIGRTPI